MFLSPEDTRRSSPNRCLQTLQFSSELLSKADRALGRLDGATEILPNPDLFVDMYVRQKAVLSSEIEGIQASLSMGLKKSPFGCGSYERFINSDDHMPILVRCALTYEQFEIIHPFLDGNGRLGRLLITFMLCEKSAEKAFALLVVVSQTKPQ